MKRKIFSLLLLCLMFSTTMFAQNKEIQLNLNEQIELNETVRTGKLENGLTYFVKSNKKPENLIEFRLAVNAGSVLEEDNQVGLAHFLEHMGFNGSKHFPGNTMDDETKKAGSWNNAYTSFDETVYMINLPKEHLDLGLKVLDSWAYGMLLTGEEIDKERGVIIEEWRRSQGGEERMWNEIKKKMLQGSKYADRMPIGTLENLQNFKYSDIRSFYEKWYNSDNMAVIIVGDFNIDSMEQKVVDYFRMSPKTCTQTQRPYIAVPDNKEPIIAIASDKEATSTSVELCYKHPSKDVKTIADFREQHLVHGLFEVMFNDRLQEISEKKSCPYMYSYAYYGGFIGRNHSAYTTRISAKEGKLMESLELVMLENRRLQQHGFLQSELDRAKDELLESYDRSAKEESKTNSSSFADRLVYYFLENEPMPSADKKNEWAKALMEDITLEEVNALISKWITEENFVCTITMPEKKGIKVPTEENVLKLIEKCKKASTKPWIDNVKTEPFLAQEPKGGKVVSQNKNEKFDYTEYTLSNGAKVILKKTNHQNDQILTRAESKGGNSLYEDKDMMNVDFASSIVNSSGIGTYDNTQLMKFMKGKSFGLYSYISNIKEVIDGSCAPKDFETQLQYFYLVFTAPRIDKEVLASEVDKLKSRISMMKNDPESILYEKQYKAMYPNDKRNIYIPTEAQIKELNTDKMLKIFKERFSDASDFTFTFVGNIDEKTMLPLIEKYIGGLPSSNGKNAEMWKDRSPDFAKGVVDETVYVGEAEKGITTIEFEHEFDYNNDRLATDALSEVCYNKLFETIREELSGTYSPSFYLSYSKYPKSELYASYNLDCNPNTIDQLTQATFKVFDKIILEGISEEDLIKAKETLILNRKKSVENNYFWLNQILGSRFNGYEMQTLEEYTAAVNALTVEDIKKVAEKYLKHDEYVRVSLKPAAMKPAK